MHEARLRSTWSLLRIGAVLLLLGIGDLVLTWQLVDHRSAEVVESNPLAALVLKSSGWTGLAAFKFGLVALFFGLTWIIERGRPAGGMLLLVFACGVHAAVVTSSMFMFLEKVQAESVELLSLEPYQPPQPLPIGAIELLNQSAVQEELKLSAAHKQTILEINRQRQKLSQLIKNANLNSCQSELENITSLENHLMLHLSTAQSERLAQLALQKRGPLSFLDSDVTNALEFGEQQYETISSLFEKLEAKQTASDASEIDAYSTNISRQLIRLLTAEQKTRWQALQGTPFDFDCGRPVALTAEATE
jgi:hypothetical protein